MPRKLPRHAHLHDEIFPSRQQLSLDAISQVNWAKSATKNLPPSPLRKGKPAPFFNDIRKGETENVR